MAAYHGPVVDVDVHHSWKSSDEIRAYLPKRWQEYASANYDVKKQGANALSRRGDPLPIGPRVTAVYASIPTEKGGTFADDGSMPGTDYATLKKQLLDPFNITRGVLTYNIGTHVNGHNRDFNVAVARAVHDWNADTWLTYDERLYGVVAPPLSVPEEAAREVRRAGAHPRIVATLLAGNPWWRPYGDPLYHPIYEASAELGLSIHIHPGASATDRPPGGLQSYSSAAATFLTHDAMHHITSFIVNGVFEKYPSLKIVVKEYGIAWLPYLMWRLDQNYELLKLESPWVKRLPSDYLREHVRLDTQPLDEGRTPSELPQLLSSIDGVEDMLIFATDYPHAAMDDPRYVARRLPGPWQRKIMFENACRFYGWPTATVEAQAANGTVDGN